jgi:hypothetical protein
MATTSNRITFKISRAEQMTSQELQNLVDSYSTILRYTPSDNPKETTANNN